MKCLLTIIITCLSIQAVYAQQDTATMKKQALRFINNQEYIQAITLLDKILQIDDMRVDVYSEKGFCAFKLGRIDQMEKASGMCIALEPNNWVHYFYRGQYYKDYEYYDKALIDLGKALSLYEPIKKVTSLDSLIYINMFGYLSWCYYSIRAFEDALAIAEMGLAVDSSELTILYDIVPPLIALKRLDEAYVYMEKCKKLGGKGMDMVQLYMVLY